MIYNKLNKRFSIAVKVWKPGRRASLLKESWTPVCGGLENTSMYIKQLFNTAAEYEQWAVRLMGWCVDPNQSIWQTNDLPILEPWFAYSERAQRSGAVRAPMTPAEKAGLELYLKLREEGTSDHNAEMRDSVQQFSPEDLAETLGLTDLNADDETGESGYNFKLVDFNYTFPLVAVGYIDSGFDRLGKIRAATLDFVEKKMFD